MSYLEQLYEKDSEKIHFVGDMQYTCHLRQITTVLNWMCEGVRLCYTVISYHAIL